ncbi:TBCC1 protein, partial [Calyptomena viridis]|nr:TBCC1 protein [Calyptomena viridis]
LLGPDPQRRLRWAETEAACACPEELERERSKARAQRAGGAQAGPRGSPAPAQGGAQPRPKGEPSPGLRGSPARSDSSLSRFSQLSVDTLQFLLFLYIQQLHKVSLRRSLLGDEWPSPRTTSPSLPGKSAGGNKNWNDQEHRAFVQSHLLDMLELLLEPEQLSASSHSSPSSLVSREAVCALSFLLEGSVGNSRMVLPLHELALWQHCHPHNGFSEGAGAFSLPRLESWLRSCLTANPVGMSACLRAGRKLAWAQQVEGTTRRAKVACSARVVPEVAPMVILSQVYKQTLAKSSETLVGAHVRIHRCNESFIYLLSVTIEKCQNSTFVLGPVGTLVHVHGCDGVKVIVVCHRLALSSTTGCTFYTLTPTQPLILSGNQAASFAPFHTHYPMLEDHMAQVGLATLPNHWDSPMLVCGDSGAADAFRLLPPSDFYPFVIPFEMEGDTTETPGGLPQPYQEVLSRRQQKVQLWQRMVKEAGLSKEQRKQFQMLVENKFYEWLVQTGNRQQLDSLVPPHGGSKQAAG